MTIFYSDDLLICDDNGLTIFKYYFPFGAEKFIPWKDIRKYETQKLSLLDGKFRIWGAFGNKWFHLDLMRPRKQSYIVLDTNHWMKPAVTPNDLTAFLSVLKSHCDSL